MASKREGHSFCKNTPFRQFFRASHAAPPRKFSLHSRPFRRDDERSAPTAGGARVRLRHPDPAFAALVLSNQREAEHGGQTTRRREWRRRYETCRRNAKHPMHCTGRAFRKWQDISFGSYFGPHGSNSAARQDFRRKHGRGRCTRGARPWNERGGKLRRNGLSRRPVCFC